MYLIHEHQENPIFTDIPELNEFKRERVRDGKKDPFLTAPKTVHVHQKCIDSSGNQLGCKLSNISMKLLLQCIRALQLTIYMYKSISQ